MACFRATGELDQQDRKLRSNSSDSLIGSDDAAAAVDT
jgi:hypothetical protein